MTGTERWRRIWMGAAGAATLVVIVFNLKPPAHVAPKARDTSEAQEVARVVGLRLIAIAPGSALERKLGREVIRSQSVRFPQLTVTASVAAHSGTVGEHTQDRWQFQSPEVSGAYADWRKAQNDAEYAGKQLAKTRELRKRSDRSLQRNLRADGEARRDRHRDAEGLGDRKGRSRPGRATEPEGRVRRRIDAEHRAQNPSGS